MDGDTGLLLALGWMELSAGRYCAAVTVEIRLLLVDGVPWCQGDLFNKELQIHSWRPEEQGTKTTLMSPLKIPVHLCQISDMPTIGKVPPDIL